jgi:uncharacterized membrane protein required for colicin V production
MLKIVDVIIILMLGLGAVLGFKRGLFKQGVITIGTVIIMIIAFALKNPVSAWMYSKLPFFNFDGIFKGVTVLNILIYEMIAFSIVAGLLAMLLRIVAWFVGLFEKALAFTVILAIPSKILGAILGAIEAWIMVFFVLYVLTLPVFNIHIVNESKWKDKILNNTPIVSKYAKSMVTTFDEIYSLKDEFKENPNSNEINKKAIDIMLKNKIVTVESVDKLIKLEKINVIGIDAILDKYR